jgi:peptide/nickel transport system substrate-binding protein
VVIFLPEAGCRAQNLRQMVWEAEGKRPGTYNTIMRQIAGEEKSMKKCLRLSLVLLCMLLVFALVACGGASKADKEGAAGDGGEINSTFNASLNGEITTLDPAFAYDWTTCPVVAQTSEGLLRYDENDQPVGWLAKDWEMVDDTTYVYNIHDKVKFWDGSPMTMEDVLYSINRYRDKKVGSYLMWMYDHVDTIEQTGPWQMTVKLKEPDALFKHVFATTAGHIHQKKAIEAAGGSGVVDSENASSVSNYGTPTVGIMATGAYEFGKWDVGSQVVFEYNPNYWNKEEMGEPDIKKIVYQNIEEDAARALALTSGQVDIDFWVPAEKVPEHDSAANINMIKFPGPTADYVAFNTNKAPLNDINLRRALASTIDIETIQKNIIKDQGAPTTGIFVPTSLYMPDKAEWEGFAQSAKKYPYDMAAAKRYLAASKHPDGAVLHMTVDGTSVNNSLALALQQAFGELGVEVKIEKTSYDDLISQLFGGGIKNGKRPYDLIVGAWAADFPDPSGVLTPILSGKNTGDGGSNSAEYNNPKVDALLDKQSALTDDAERAKVMQEAITLVNEDVPYYVHSHTNYLFGVNERVASGFEGLGPMWTWKPFIADVKLNK